MPPYTAMTSKMNPTPEQLEEEALRRVIGKEQPLFWIPLTKYEANMILLGNVTNRVHEMVERLLDWEPKSRG